MITRGKQRQKGSARRGRYATPEPLPPDPKLLQHYLHVAQPDRPEPARSEARRNLLWIHKYARLTGVAAFQLHMFVDDLMTEVWSSGNPETAMTWVCEGERERGRPREDAYGDFMIAADVADRVHKGKTVTKACKEAALLAALSPERVKSIYYNTKKHEGARLRLEVSCRGARDGLVTY